MLGFELQELDLGLELRIGDSGGFSLGGWI